MMCIELKDKLTALGCGIMLSALCLACTDNMDIVDSSTELDDVPASYISLNISLPTRNILTRANPTGGEDGDGSEKGTVNDYTDENTISTVTLFLYKDVDGSGINASSTNAESETVTPVTFDALTDETSDVFIYDKTYSSKDNPVRVKLEDGEYHVIAVANLSSDDLTSLKSCTNLATLRDYIQKTAWTYSDSKYSSFIMASENDKNTITLNSNSKSNPAMVSVEVERLAARIDYKTNENNSYTITSEEGETNEYAGSTVKILGGTIVNKLSAGTYLLKRVAESSESSDVTYLGDEEPDAGVETNYVIDPWTKDKGTSETVTIDGTSGQSFSALYDNYYPGQTSNSASYWDGLCSAGFGIDTDWNCLGYTLENTTFSKYTSKDYATGVVFQAQFTPASGLVKSDYSNQTFTSGDTFFKWNGTLYATLEDVLYANNETDLIGKVSSCSDWDGLSSLIDDYSTAEPTGYVQYLKDLYDGKKEQVFTLYSEELPWDYYASNYLGYSLSSGVITLDKFGENKAVDYSSTQEAISEISNGAIETFKQGKCYYTWWVRHSNDGVDTENGVMEFAIVRNNIYRLEVESITTLGGEVPTEGFQSNIHVVQWTLLDTETIKF